MPPSVQGRTLVRPFLKAVFPAAERAGVSGASLLSASASLSGLEQILGGVDADDFRQAIAGIEEWGGYLDFLGRLFERNARGAALQSRRRDVHCEQVLIAAATLYFKVHIRPVR
jgi:hypothetical protein